MIRELIPNYGHTKKKKKIRAYYQNVRGLRTKTEIQSKISASQFELIAFTEHWLNDEFVSSEYFDDSYFVERNDRKRPDKKWGGGALIAIKNSIPYKRYCDWENETAFENVWIEIKTKSYSQKIFVNVVYIPPSTRFDQYQKYFDVVTEIMCAREPNAKFLIMGDFNMGASIEWFVYNGECLALSHEGDIADDLINTLEITELNQLNHIRNNNHRILDLALSNTCDFTLFPIPDFCELSRIDQQNPPFEIQLSSNDIKFMKPEKTIKLNFFKADYELINYELNCIDWDERLDFADVDNQIDAFYHSIENIINKFTPTILPKDDKYPKWFSKKLIELISDKNYFYDKFKFTNNECFNVAYKKKRKEVKYELRACERKYTLSIEESIKLNTKAFFAYTKSLNKSNRLPNVMKLNNVSSDNPTIIAIFFADHFESVYTVDDDNEPIQDYTCNCAEHFEITEEIIANIIRQMNENKSNSPDNVPIMFYSIVKPLKIIFNNSLRQRIFPSKWKMSLLTPLHKNGDKSDVLNYRPISIITAASKVFEKIMYISIQKKVQHLIRPEQHGFTKNKSTISNLAEYVEWWSDRLYLHRLRQGIR